ncbi:MAG: endonuclease [Acidiferrobacteraceae bacterium]
MKASEWHVWERLREAYEPSGWWPAQSRFEVMVGAILTQNTAWTNVEKAIAELRRADRLTPEAIAAMPADRLAPLIRSSGYFNIKAGRLKALAEWVCRSGGIAALDRMPTGPLREELLAVRGVGPETADDILLYAFSRPVFVVDAYTRRLFSRLGVISGEEPYEVLRRRFEDACDGGVAQFREYHALIVRHAKQVCRSRPLCPDCVLRDLCPAGFCNRTTPVLE